MKLFISLILVGLVSFVAILFYVNFTDKSFTTIQKSYPLNSLSTYKEGELIKGDLVTGQFRSVENNLGIVSIRFEVFDRVNRDIFVFRIKEQGSNSWYYENEYESSKFGGYPLFPFGFPIITEAKGKLYYFELESLKGKLKDAVALKKEEPVIVTTHKFAVSQLLRDRETLLTFSYQKVMDLFAHEQALQNFFFIYTILASALFLFAKRKKVSKSLSRLVKKIKTAQARQLKKKQEGIERWIEKANTVFLFVVKAFLFIGKNILQILSLLSKWLKKE